MIDWKRVPPRDFERICGELLELSGFRNLKWYGKAGGDKGRDLTATKPYSPFGHAEVNQRWIVQCKRHLAKPLGKGEIASFLTAAREHKPNAVLLVVTATLTGAVRDWLESVRDDYKFEIFLWEERDLEREVARHRKKLSVKLKVVPQSRKPAWFYEMGPLDRVYSCNEIEEVGFWVMNPGDRAEDIERIREFIDFVRHNEVEFDKEADDDE